jgi:hypothetical protein
MVRVRVRESFMLMCRAQAYARTRIWESARVKVIAKSRECVRVRVGLGLVLGLCLFLI